MTFSMSWSDSATMAGTLVRCAGSAFAGFFNPAKAPLDLGVALIHSPLPRLDFILIGLELPGLQLIGRCQAQGVTDEHMEVVEAPVDTIEALVMLFQLAADPLQFRAHFTQLHEH